MPDAQDEVRCPKDHIDMKILLQNPDFELRLKFLLRNLPC